MNRINIFLIASLLISNSALSQSFPDYNVLSLKRQLTSIKFSTAEKGYAFGKDTRYSSVNGGKSWIFDHVDLNIGSAVFFVDSLNWWATNRGDSILRSSNGGDKWHIVNTNSNAEIIDIFFVNSLTGWAIGNVGNYSGVLIKTTNAGLSWQEQNCRIKGRLTSSFFVDDNTGWVTAGNTDSFSVTRNGGSSWSASTSGTGRWLTKVNFLNSTTGWILGNPGFVMKTTNRGTNWDLYYGTFGNTIDIKFADSLTGWISCTRGNIYKSTNGGINWTLQLSSTSGYYDLLSLYFKDHNTGWACGREGLIYSTSNGGTNWIKDTANLPDGNINKTVFVNRNIGWCSVNGQIWKTDNSGHNWTKQYSGNFDIYGLSFANVTNGTAVGSHGNVISTTNGGSDWNLQTIGSSKLNSSHRIDESNGYITGDSGLILRTSDKGISWGQVNSNTTENLYSITSITPSEIFCVGANGIVLHSIDSGNNWSIQNLSEEDNISIIFRNATTGFILSHRHYVISWNVIYDRNRVTATTDGGASWFTVYNNINYQGRIINSISFRDSLYGCITDNKGGIMITNSGGFSWNSHYENLLDDVGFSTVTFTDNYGWISGDHGLMMTTSNNFVGINNEYSSIPPSFELSQNFPNPFNPVTSIKLDLKSSAFVKLKVYDIQGKLITTIVDKELSQGTYEFKFNGQNHSSGVYYYIADVIDSSNKKSIQTKKMVLLK